MRESIALLALLAALIAQAQESRLQPIKPQMGTDDAHFEEQWQMNRGSNGAFQIGIAAEQRFDLVRARKAYERAAREGYAPAQYRLGLMVCRPKALAVAVRYLRAAAEQSYAPAMNQLALMYLDGEGVPPDPNKAIELLQASSSLGYGPALNNLGVAYADRNKPGDLKVAYEMLLLAGRRGNRHAMSNARALARGLTAQERKTIEQAVEIAAATLEVQ